MLQATITLLRVLAATAGGAITRAWLSYTDLVESGNPA